MKTVNLGSLAFGLALAVAATGSFAQATVTVTNNGTLTSSVGLLSTDPGAVTNDLTLLPAGTATAFNFSGATGSNTSLTSGGYFFTDYLIDITPGTAESVSTTLSNPLAGGVTGLNERIYQVPSTGNTFLGTAAVPSGLIQAWSTNSAVPGASISYVAPVDLTAPGLYVVEIRGTTAGSFGGTLSITAVPEASTSILLVAGLLLLGFTVVRSRTR